VEAAATAAAVGRSGIWDFFQHAKRGAAARGGGGGGAGSREVAAAWCGSSGGRGSGSVSGGQAAGRTPDAMHHAHAPCVVRAARRYKDLEGSLDQKLTDARIMEDQPILLEDKVGPEAWGWLGVPCAVRAGFDAACSGSLGVLKPLI
jgi:hypothetical protein